MTVPFQFAAVRGRRVLVTGASSGIGAEMARLFAAHGARVGIHFAQNEAGARATLDAITTGGGEARLFAGDLRLAPDREQLVPAFLEAFGGVDVLINNAGAAYDYRHFSELGEEAWDQTFAVNTKAPFILSRAAFAAMQAQGGGRIINISTVAVNYVGPASLHYAASKAALETLTLGFAREGARYNILVNSIRCGVIDTPMHTKITGYRPELFEKRVKLVPLGRPGTPPDVARMALFLASEGGDFITGECFTVAGGD